MHLTFPVLTAFDPHVIGTDRISEADVRIACATRIYHDVIS
jgi:hypothetical protein